MAARVELTREQVVSYRVAAHGLLRETTKPSDLAVLDLGVQDTPAGSAPVALSVRLVDPQPPGDVTDDGRFSLVWSHRGAPHLHRTGDLPDLAVTCPPRDDADAAARATVAAAVAAELVEPLTKAQLSGRVTGRIPPALSPFCQPCDVHHVGEQLLRVSALSAGLRLTPGSRPLLLDTVPGWDGPSADGGTAVMQRTYRSLFGTATDAEIAEFLGTDPAVVAGERPDGIVEARVDGRTTYVDGAALDGIRAARPDADVRFLPPSDPLLAGRDRQLLVADPAERSALWRSMHSPGAVLSAGDVVGTWRARMRSAVLDVRIEWFGARVVDTGALTAEAERLAVVRGARDVRLTT